MNRLGRLSVKPHQKLAGLGSMKRGANTGNKYSLAGSQAGRKLSSQGANPSHYFGKSGRLSLDGLVHVKRMAGARFISQSLSPSLSIFRVFESWYSKMI